MRRNPKLDLVLRWSGLVALLITAAWTYFKFDLGGGTDWMVNVTIETEILPYTQDARLLVVHVKTKNPTTSRFAFDTKLSSFKLHLHEVPANLQATRAISFDKQPLLVPEIDLMAGDGSERIYMPGAEFDDSELFVVHVNTTVHIDATIETKPGFRQEPDFVNAERTVRITDK